MTKAILSKIGYNVLAAATPGEAMKLARKYNSNIHLLMTDVIMPEMNGRDLAKNIVVLYPDIKRLFMSGYTACYCSPWSIGGWRAFPPEAFQYECIEWKNT